MSEQPDHVRKALAEEVVVEPYDPSWPRLFEEEKRHLREILPSDLIGRIEHFGSTAVPGLAAKPIIDMLVEVPSLETVHQVIAPILQKEGYDYFWRPRYLGGDEIGYTWFIKRDAQGRRTHHIHMLEKGAREWERLLFRDYLIEHPEVAEEYGKLKERLQRRYARDRKSYSREKTAFIEEVTRKARERYG
ncbi:MAG: hypothetical protein Kow006_20710 [Gammaproteobacteria bacterium]